MHDSLPEGPFRTISADPPWPYGTSSSGHFVIPKPQDEVDRGHRGVETMGYEPMPMDEILALPVRDVADSSAHLYLWVTNAFIAEGMEVMAAWGFKYKTMLTWTKTQDSHPIRVSMKSGFYFRGATEHVLFGVRGSCPPPDGLALPTGYLWPRLARHSEKPHEFYRDVAEKMSPEPRLEMFARGPRVGWTTWGNQAEDPDSLFAP